MSVLQIESSARVQDSNTRTLTQYIVERIAQPVVQRDLAQQPLPSISAEDFLDVYAGTQNDRPSLQQHRALSDQLIAELMAADTLVVGVAMYNFGIPAVLKQWVDYVCRSGITFKYGATGPVGLTGIKRAFIVTASGGTPIGADADYASGHIAQICRFIGVEEIIHVHASGSKGAPEQVIAQAKQQIDNALDNSVASEEVL